MPEPARARVHCWLVCDGAWCRGTVRGRGLLGGSAKACEPRVTHACGAVIFWGAGFTAACAAGGASAVSSCVRGGSIARAAGSCMIVVAVAVTAAPESPIIAIAATGGVMCRRVALAAGTVCSTAHKRRQLQGYARRGSTGVRPHIPAPIASRSQPPPIDSAVRLARDRLLGRHALWELPAAGRRQHGEVDEHSAHGCWGGGGATERSHR